MRTLGTRTGYLTVAGLTLALVLGHYSGVFSSIEGAWQKSVAGLGAPLHAFIVSVREFPAFQEKKKLLSQIEELEKQKSANQELIVRYETLREENRALREAVAWSKETSHRHSIARIMGRALNLPNTHIIINRGSNHGVLTGLPVVSGADILIGQVVKVSEETSVVRMINDNQSRISVKVVGSQTPTGLVVGDLGFSLKLTFIPAQHKLSVGDVVVTSGLDEKIPDNLIVGTVASEPRPVDDFFSEAPLSTATEFNTLVTVAVLLPHEE